MLSKIDLTQKELEKTIIETERDLLKMLDFIYKDSEVLKIRNRNIFVFVNAKENFYFVL